MSYLDDELTRWGQELENVHLPRWDDLPDFLLYMDQVIALVNDYLAFSHMRPDEKFLTPAMINNYVKLKMMPKPVKKRYNRVHMAHLIIILLLKPVLSIAEIKEGIQLQVIAFQGGYKPAYNLFCKQYECTLHYMARVAQGEHVSDPIMEKLRVEMLGTYMAGLSVASKLFAQKVLLILEEGAGRTEDKDKRIGGSEGHE